MHTVICAAMLTAALGPPWGVPPVPSPAPTIAEVTAAPDLTPRPTVDHMTMGDVYRVLPGERTRVSFHSHAPMGAFDGQTGDLLGFAIVERHCLRNDWTPGTDDLGTPRGVLLAGTFVAPIRSLSTGIAQRDEHLASNEWLDASSNPVLTFELTAFERPRLIRREAGVATFEGALVGDMIIHASRKPLRIEGATVALMPRTEESARYGPGDLLMIRCAYELKLADFGLDHPLIGRSVGEKVRIEQAILMTTALPEAPPEPEPVAEDGPPQQGERITDITTPPPSP